MWPQLLSLTLYNVKKVTFPVVLGEHQALKLIRVSVAKKMNCLFEQVRLAHRHKILEWGKNHKPLKSFGIKNKDKIKFRILELPKPRVQATPVQAPPAPLPPPPPPAPEPTQAPPAPVLNMTFISSRRSPSPAHQPAPAKSPSPVRSPSPKTIVNLTENKTINNNVTVNRFENKQERVQVNSDDSDGSDDSNNSDGSDDSDNSDNSDGSDDLDDSDDSADLDDSNDPDKYANRCVSAPNPNGHIKYKSQDDWRPYVFIPLAIFVIFMILWK